MIAQELREIQERCGYLPAEELEQLASRLEVPRHRLHEVASCFPLYRLTPPPEVEVKVCRDMACHLAGAPKLRQNLESLATEVGGGQLVIDGISCLGQCDHAPAVQMTSRGAESVYRGLDEKQLRAKIRSALAREPLKHQHGPTDHLGWQIDPYDGKPLYEALRQFVEGNDVDGLLKKLKIADLRGMGGAGFRTHLKWSTVRNVHAPVKYIVCNGDESEPGTFKDREILRRTPYLLLEGVVLAGLVTGATQGYIYIRHEYEEEIEAMRAEIERARERNLCGDNILGSGKNFPVEVFVSPGGYICGEESALLEAMEDRRAEPRNKPPFPVFQGLFGKPTVINNVETLSWVPAILKKGGEWYRDAGVRGATGLRFVSISGDVNRPGVYEVPFGQTVRELIHDCCGGMKDGQRLKAIAPSGPSCGYLPAVITEASLPLIPGANIPMEKAKEKLRELSGGTGKLDILDLPLDLNTLGLFGGMLGAAFVAVGDRACMVDMALNATAFYRNESCGKCVPCRMGSQKLVEVLTAVTSGQESAAVVDAVPVLAETMTVSSICGLGMVASNPITTVMAHFRDEFDRHVREGRCPAGVCTF